MYNGMRSVPYLHRNRKYNIISPELTERIMLAVTEVNGCDVCSYAHTKMALETGMSKEEITNILSGSMEDIPPDEIKSIIFAQYYADARGNPSKESWNNLVMEYGPNKSYTILASVRMIMMGNALGIPWSSFFKRLKGKKDVRSSFLYELQIIILGSILFPVAAVNAVLSSIIGLKII